MMAATSMPLPYICARCIRAQASRAVQQKRPITTTALRATTQSSRPRVVEQPRISTRNKRSFPAGPLNLSVPREAAQTNRHAYSTSTSTSTTAPQTRITAPLPWRRLIVVHGKDTAKFLQGILTQDINMTKLREEFRNGRAVYSAALDAKGRMYAEMLLYPWDAKEKRPVLTESEERQGLCLEVDKGVVEHMRAHLRKHKLRSKVKIEVREGWRVRHHWDADTRSEAVERDDGSSEASPQSSLPSFVTDESNAFFFLDPRFHGADAHTKFRSLEGSFSPSPPTPSPLSQSQSAYTTHRHLHAIAEGPLESPPGSALAYDSNIDIHNGISFHKGCYLGQELVIRTKHTGVVRKRVLPVRLSTTNSGNGVGGETLGKLKGLPLDIYPIPTEEGRKVRARPVGKLLAHQGPVGLALVRLDVTTNLRLTAEEVAQREPPPSPGSAPSSPTHETSEEARFYVSTASGEKLGVEVIVPEWFPALVEPRVKEMKEAREVAETPDEEDLLEDEDGDAETAGEERAGR